MMILILPSRELSCVACMLAWGAPGGGRLAGGG